MGKQAGPHPNEFGELRILVLHNRDFAPEQPSEAPADHLADPGEMGPPGVDPGLVARADVVNAARDVARALVTRGHFVEVQGTDIGDVGPLLSRLQGDRPDVVFNLCESLGGDSRQEIVIPTLLDMLRIPYTGSGSLALALALRKDRTKDVLRSAGVPTPMGVVLPAGQTDADADLNQVYGAGLSYPLIVKPAREDASVGISTASVVHDDDALCQRIALVRRLYRQPILVEQYIAGREIYVSMLGNDPPHLLPLHEIDFSLLPSGRPHIVSYEAKWDPASVEYQSTKSLRAGAMHAGVQDRIEQAARATFAALEMADYGRCDIRLSDNGTPYVIDVNPNCDLSDGAGFSMAARCGGLAYDQTIEHIAQSALYRSQHDFPQKRADWPALHVLDPAGTAGGSSGAAPARLEGRSVFAGRGELRTVVRRQRAL